MLKFYVEGRLPTLNEYTKTSRGNKYASAKMKADAEEIIIWNMRVSAEGKAKPPYFISFTWYESTKRRDKDNVCFAKKFILDALQKSKTIENDSNKYITGFKDLFIYGKKQGVGVTIKGADEGVKCLDE